MSESEEAIWVCGSCAHTWTERRPAGDDPTQCEDCGYRQLHGFPTRIVGNAEAAEEFSQSVLERHR